MQYREWRIPTKDVWSLAWSGDRLVDWVGGGTAYELDGTRHGRAVHYAYRFDAATVSPSGEYVVIYERLGTKGVVLRNGEIVREIDRSFYYANAYAFPVTLFRLPNGREALAHCPERYCHLQIEDAATGERLTACAERKFVDVFHSRLVANSAGTYLLSAGWLWQPWGVAGVYDVRRALKDPRILDGLGEGPRTAAEICSAAFLDDATLLLATSGEEVDLEPAEDDEEPDALAAAGPHSVGIYDLARGRMRSVARVGEPIGALMPVGLRHAIGFYGHPKLIELGTGAILRRWSDLETGDEDGSIQWGRKSFPALALDAERKRFAVADPEGITVVALEPR